MKSTLVRCFVLVLAVAGFTATSFSSPKTVGVATIDGTAAKATAPVSILGSPTPLCLPSDKTYCGMD
jgi:hypothetical protein